MKVPEICRGKAEMPSPAITSIGPAEELWSSEAYITR